MESYGTSNLHESRLMLKPYHIIDCPDDVQSIIQEKVLNYLRDNTDLLTRTDLQLWNKIKTADIVRAVPEIHQYFMSLGLRVKEIGITVWNRHDDVNLHIDELPVTAKINFPICNTQHTYNEWYTVPEELMATVTPMINSFGYEYYRLDTIDLSKCTKIGETETLKPIVFNSQMPHKIRVAPEAQFPRIVMPCIFMKEPLHLLQPVSIAATL